MSEGQSMKSVGVIGASGYAGGELVRLLDAHPAMRLDVVAGHSSAGKALGEVHPHLTGGERVLLSQDEALEADVDLMFLALPHGSSAAPAMGLLDRGIAVADLGSDFRLTSPDRYQAAYGAAHPHPDQLGEWAYGLPELFRKDLAGADRVAPPDPVGRAPSVRFGIVVLGDAAGDRQAHGRLEGHIQGL